MPLPRPRLTVGRLMPVVAMVAMILGVWLWGERRRARFLALAGWLHSRIGCVFFGYPGPDGEFVYEATSSPQKSGDPPVSPRQQHIDTWHRNIAVRYWRAAQFPFLPVGADPPPRE